MKQNIKALVWGAFMTLSFIACKKNDHPPVPNPVNDLEKMQAFFDKHRPYAEKFTVDATNGGTIILKSGTRITFAPGAFIRKNGGTPVTGAINVTAKDILKASDMILDDKPTVAGKGAMLESFGELIVNADQNGDTLALNPAVQRPANVVVPIGLVGEEGAAEGAFREGIAMWTGDTTVTFTTGGHNHENEYVTITQTVAAKKGMEWLNAPGFGFATASQTTFPLIETGTWVNCDALYNDPRPKTTVLGYFGDKFNTQTGGNYSGSDPSLLFFKTRETNTVVKLYNVIFNPIPGKEGLLSYQNSIPVGQEGTFIAISTKGGKFYAEVKDITIPAPAAGKNYTGIDFNLTEVSEAQLIHLINQMNTK